VTDAATFTCPRCGRTSHNPNDAREGYCGACHDWTGEDDWLAAENQRHEDEMAQRREWLDG
jgi:ribosomal protein L37E